MAYDCWIPFFRRQPEHHILVGPPDLPFGVGGHSHVQLGVCCTCLVVPFAVRLGLVECQKISNLQVTWQPYETDAVHDMALNDICKRDQDL
jgi:hypothetical protein